MLDVHGAAHAAVQLPAGIPRGAVCEGPEDRRATLAEHDTAAPVSSVVQQLVTALVADGRGDDDYSALATVLFGLSGLGEMKDDTPA